MSDGRANHAGERALLVLDVVRPRLRLHFIANGEGRSSFGCWATSAVRNLVFKVAIGFAIEGVRVALAFDDRVYYQTLAFSGLRNESEAYSCDEGP